MEEQNLNVSNDLQVQTDLVNEPIQENVNNVETEKSIETQPEGSGSDVNIQTGITEPIKDENPVQDQPVVSDEIQKKLDKLKEYEVKDNEINELRQRLGVPETQDNVVFQANQELAMFENQAQQEYIKLCNKFGVDYRADKIDASGKELLEKDPKAFYQLRYELENLTNRVNAKREQVQSFIANRDMNIAIERNRQVLDVSPVMKNHVNNLIKEGLIDAGGVDMVVNIGRDIAREAYEMGRQAALAESQAKTTSPAQVLNNNVITQQATAPLGTPTTLTLADVEKMDVKTYAKNAALIDKLIAEGRLK